MPTNVFFNHAVNTEQHLYEDLVVESLRFYGHETYYLPREIVEEDTILGEDVQSSFGDAYSVEMYLDNVEGFEGEDLFSKFGIQTQEECTFEFKDKQFTYLIERILVFNISDFKHRT